MMLRCQSPTFLDFLEVRDSLPNLELFRMEPRAQNDPG